MAHGVCPWWLGPLLVTPLRRLLYDPEKILKPCISEGMTALDAGCGMGFFSLPLARLVGGTGKVICVDLQDKMIKGLIRRARKAQLSERIDARVCRQDHLDLDDIAGQVDFALAFALIHEVSDKDRLLSEICRAMKPEGRLLISEPSGHVGIEEFNSTVQISQASGFEIIERPEIRRNHAILLQKI